MVDDNKDTCYSRDCLAGDHESNVVFKGGKIVSRMKDNSLDAVMKLVGVCCGNVVLASINTPESKVKVV